MWKGEEILTDSEVGVRFTHVSPDGDEGFPGMFVVPAVNVENLLFLKGRGCANARFCVFACAWSC